jgi:hypothetical protein
MTYRRRSLISASATVAGSPISDIMSIREEAPLPTRVESGGSGYSAAMTDEKTEAMQAVVDRVTSWQDGAPEGTVEAELRDGFTRAGVDVDDADITKLAEAIESRHSAVQVTDVLS